MVGEYRTYRKSIAGRLAGQNWPESTANRFGAETPELAQAGQGELPICLFGPGEGYYSSWPGRDFQPGSLSITLRRVLAGIGRWLRRQEKPVAARVELDATGQPSPGPLEQLALRLRDRHAEVLLTEEDQTAHLAESPALPSQADAPTHRLIWELNYERNTEANGSLAPDKRLSSQAWLFADHAGIGQQLERQQSNGLSAHRSPRRKRASAKVATQGTLFGT